MRSFEKSHKLDNVCYDIRGPVLREAKRLEAEGYRVLKLNIGNPAAFGFTAPDEILHDIIVNLQNAQGYCDSQGLFPARKAVMQEFQEKGIMDVTVDDVFIGNGVSELIMMAMQGLLNEGDEVLIPAPDYPLWTAAVNLSGGTAVHYRCDEASAWNPDIKDLASKITSNTKAIVVINPNNPTGAVYERDILEAIAHLAAEHGLIVFADEIYDKILYDGATHVPMASINPDILTITFNGLSKAYRAAGFRSGWMVLSGNKKLAAGYREGLEMLSNMRLCANVPAQYGIQTALGGYQSIRDLVLPGGRLKEQRDLCVSLVNSIPGLSVVPPRGALYCFPRIDTKRFNITNDEQFVMDLLRSQHILLVHGTGFNWFEPDHFRIVFLPDTATLADALGRLKTFLQTYRQVPDGI
ncbi:MAG TPA: pyridoxal phosphate-dependent aminotransferase [Termitinemataceae bacterium]|nr:pyridoxal phosphate-dependent aminotransferase [Termitinemataceae bacterium]HOM22701.1 pyridoxal phosphate-dependent aminotransferase [Termitinemataceae bacterium]HPP99540.1 pyridoxal phosphate-dependent aminotransferase [Termitinemataceae bacterium]